jgi:hypothetical protein
MRLIRAWRGRSGAEMPLTRYFFFVGGVLLALLLISGWLLPKFPMTETADIGADKSFLRISSDRKWPERVVFDTSVAPIAPVETAMTEEAVTPPARDAVADVSARMRDAFAQLEPSDQKLEPSDQKKPDRKKAESKPHWKHKIAKKHLAPSRVLVAQQPRFGFFVSNIW